MLDASYQKSRARIQAKAQRANCAVTATASAVELIGHFPAAEFRGSIIGGIWPLQGEIDSRPLMTALSDAGFTLALPCTPRKGQPLTFRHWSIGQALKAGPYGTREPFPNAAPATPTCVLVPFLAFTERGERLGYGGGFYDRTLAALKLNHAVFACGVGFAAQEAASLPTDDYDVLLDGVLTDRYFKRF